MATAPTPIARGGHLKVIDGGTGEWHDELAPVPTEVAALKDVVVTVQRQLAAARGELTKLRKVDPEAEQITELLERWRQRCMPRAKIDLDGKRAAAVKRMLGHYESAELVAVIDFAADMPYEMYGNRFAEPGPGRVKRVDAIFLFADTSRVDRLLEVTLERETDAALDAYKRALWARLKAEPVLVATLASLGREPRAEVIVGAVRWAATERAAARTEWLGNPS